MYVALGEPQGKAFELTSMTRKLIRANAREGMDIAAIGEHVLSVVMLETAFPLALQTKGSTQFVANRLEGVPESKSPE
jgi:hypothetical protein